AWLESALGGAAVRAVPDRHHAGVPQLLGVARRAVERTEDQLLQERLDPGRDADGVRLRARTVQHRPSSSLDHSRWRESSQSVTGPSLTSATSMCAPKTQVGTGLPSNAESE